MYPNYKNKSKKAAEFIWKDLSIDDFPKECSKEDLFIKNERNFHLLISMAPKIQRSLGWSGILNSNVFYPDVTALLIGGDLIKVELEYDASNFIKHGHSGKNCDLIITFIRKPHQDLIMGLPVWSFYLDKEDKMIWTLQNDIISNQGIDDLDYEFLHDENNENY